MEESSDDITIVKRLYPIVTGMEWKADYDTLIYPIAKAKVSEDKIEESNVNLGICYYTAHLIVSGMGNSSGYAVASESLGSASVSYMAGQNEVWDSPSDGWIIRYNELVNSAFLKRAHSITRIRSKCRMFERDSSYIPRNMRECKNRRGRRPLEEVL